MSTGPNARNRGVAAAKGAYIIWTDDDVLVESGWLAAYVSAFSRYPAVSLFGGKVVPELEPPTPDWFSNNLDLLADLIVQRDFGPDELELSLESKRLPYGANYAVRTIEQRKFPYDPNLGVSPRFRRSGEETAVVRAMLRAGNTGRWIPSACVTHVLASNRQTAAQIVAHRKGIGETWAYLSDTRGDEFMGKAPPPGKLAFGAPVWVYRRMVEHALQALVARPVSTRRWLTHLLQYGYYRGAVDYWVQANRRA